MYNSDLCEQEWSYCTCTCIKKYFLLPFCSFSGRLWSRRSLSIITSKWHGLRQTEYCLFITVGTMSPKIIMIDWVWQLLSLPFCQLTGADPGFSFGGRGAKDYVPARTLRAQNQTHFRQGSGPAYKGPGSSVLTALTPYLSLLFKHSEKKNWI